MTRRRGGVARVLGFSLSPVIGVVSPLLALPLVTDRYGAEGWAAVALGQAFGAAVAVLVGLGWSLNGPQAVAAADPAGRARLYAASIVSRAPVFVLGTVAGAALSPLLSPGHVLVCALSLAGSAAIGLSPAWFYTGAGRPGMVLAADSVPKLVAVLASCVALARGAPLWVYPAALLAASLLAPFVGVRAFGLTARAAWDFDRSAIGGVLREQRLSSAGQLLSTVYLTLPVVLVGAVAPAAVPVFAAADRLQRMALNVLNGFPLALQSWIGGAVDVPTRDARLRTALAANAGLGVVAGAAFWALAPWFSALVFSGEATVSATMAFWCGVIVVLTCTSRAVGGLGLVARRRIGWLTASAGTGAVVGVPLILALTPRGGAVTALAVLALTEAVVLAVQVVGYTRASARGGDRSGARVGDPVGPDVRVPRRGLVGEPQAQRE